MSFCDTYGAIGAERLQNVTSHDDMKTPFPNTGIHLDSLLFRIVKIGNEFFAVHLCVEINIELVV